jgi:hypothetical protein
VCIESAFATSFADLASTRLDPSLYLERTKFAEISGFRGKHAASDGHSLQNP